MTSDLRARLDANGGAASIEELAGLGIDRFAIARLIRTGELVRIRRDAVADGLAWASASEEERHVLRGRAVIRSLDPAGSGPYALSHHSAVAIHGLPCFGVDGRVHLVRTDGKRGRVSARVHGHPPILPHWVEVVEDVRVVRPARAVLQVAATAGVASGLVAADAALHSGLCSRAEIDAAVAAGGYGAGIHHVRKVAELADGRIESPGESRLRWLIQVIGFPALTPQAVIADDHGVVIARVDFLFAEAGVVVEFDGRVKYSDGDSIWAEKRREDAIRDLGYEVVRITWADLAHPERVRALLRQAFRRAAARHLSPA